MKFFYRLLMMLGVVLLLFHSYFVLDDINQCGNSFIEIFFCNFISLGGALGFLVVFLLNEIFIYKITKRTFPRMLFFVPLSIFLFGALAIIASLLIADLTRVGDSGLGLLMIYLYGVGIMILAGVYLMRLFVQYLFLNFFRKMPFLILDKYFYHIIYIIVLLTFIFYIISFINLYR